MVVVVLLVVVVAVVVSGYVLRSRTEQGIESGISSFRREMRALAPRDGELDPRAPSSPPRPVDQDPGVHLLGDSRPSHVAPDAAPPVSASGDASAEEIEMVDDADQADDWPADD